MWCALYRLSVCVIAFTIKLNARRRAVIFEVYQAAFNADITVDGYFARGVLNNRFVGREGAEYKLRARLKIDNGVTV